MISDRIRQLVDEQDGGNVSAAARRLDCPQRTLAKVYSGETKNPRADLLQAVVKFYLVDPGWLLTGVESGTWATGEARTKQQAIHILKQLLESLED